MVVIELDIFDFWVVGFLTRVGFLTQMSNRDYSCTPEFFEKANMRPFDFGGEK